MCDLPSNDPLLPNTCVVVRHWTGSVTGIGGPYSFPAGSKVYTALSVATNVRTGVSPPKPSCTERVSRPSPLTGKDGCFAGGLENAAGPRFPPLTPSYTPNVP